MTSYEKAIDDAISALEHRLKNREPDAYDRAFAAEFVQAMLGRGWRPTEARSPQDWQALKPGAGAPPGDDYRAALDEVREKGRRAARELGHDAGAVA